MKRLTVLSVLLALGLVIGLHGLTVTVGSTTEYNDYFPVFSRGRYNYNQQIYTGAQINHAGEISRIRFYHQASMEACLLYSHDWTIYLGHTDRDSFTSTLDWEPFANLTQVFSGSVLSMFPPPRQWMEIVLDTPFIYDNTRNLVVAIHEHTPYSGSYLHWGGFDSGAYRGLAINDRNNTLDPDPADPFEANLITSDIASIQLVFPDIEAPQAPTLLNPDDGASVINGNTLDWILTQGSADVTGYDLYIDGVLVSENQTAHSYQMRGLEPGNHTWYVVAKNDFGSSAASETRSFVTLPGVTIGHKNLAMGLPISVYSICGYSQSIYLQSEIDVSNRRIESISYYWSGTGVGVNSGDWVIYMGHTTKTQFAANSDWVPISQMLQVFDGHVDMPAVAGWITIQLDNPFLYNNTDNLVIAVAENTYGGTIHNDTDFYFYNTYSPYQHRSIVYSDSDPVNPDIFPPSAGFLKSCYPNIWLQFGDLPTEPVFNLRPAALDFGLLLNGETAQPQKAVAFNAGGGTLNLTMADISIIGPNAAEFSFDPTNLPAALGPGQTVQIPVSVTGESTGQISATLRLACNGENYDVQLDADIAPTGTIRIGDGKRGREYPFMGYYHHELSATIYTADQIGATGFIDALAWDCMRTSDAVIPYKIWAKNTNINTFGVQYWEELMTGMTLVKQGVHIPNTLGWQNFKLDTPFAYTGANLIILVETEVGDDDNRQGHLFRYTQMEMGRHQGLDRVPGLLFPPTGILSDCVANIMMHMVANLDDDISAVDISGEQIPIAGEASNYTVRVKNNGSNPQDNYQVKLMGPGNVELAVVNGIPIESGATAEVVIPWTPDSEGLIGIFGKVVLAADQDETNNRTKRLQVNVQPAGSQTITIGAGDELARFPIDLTERSTIYQCIYFDDELDFATGTITGIVVYNQFSNTFPNVITQIFMGSTDQDNLRVGCIPISEMRLVYSGYTTYPAGENAVYFKLQRPYLHTGGNLVIMLARPEGPGYSSIVANFKCQTVGKDRARYSLKWYENEDLGNLPMGSLTGQFPQTTFLYTADVYENELAALDITGNKLPAVGELTNYTVRIRNYGQQTQNNYQVKLMGPDRTELAVVNGTPVDSGAIVEVVIPWTPDIIGPTELYAKVELAGDAVAANNLTNTLRLNVQAQDYQTATVGAGNSYVTNPMYFFRNNSLYQTLYLEEELGFASGIITSIELKNRFQDNIPNAPTRIYLGTTDRTNLGRGWVSANELNLVFDGLVDYPVGTNTIHIQLQTPYQYNGGNLVMMFHRPMDTRHYSSGNGFRGQMVGYDRVRHSAGNTIEIDPYNPPNGMISGLTPQATFYYTHEYAQNDLMALSISSEAAPVVGVASSCTVRIKNIGTTTQTNYKVKLMGPNDAELAFVYGPPLSCNQTAEVTVFWTPQNAGNYAIYGKVDLDGDENGANDSTPSLEIMVYPCGVTDVMAVEDGPYVQISWSAPERIAASDGIGKVSALSHADKSGRSTAGYLVYRLQAHQMENENSWTVITPFPITTLSYADEGWETIACGIYYWAVKVIHSSGYASLPGFSNVVWKGSPGTIKGTVRRTNTTPIAGATVSSQFVSTETDASGAYSLVHPMGTHAVTASAPGFISQTVEIVNVIPNDITTLDFVLKVDTAGDDPQNPVLATALNGNYPNPFNPETTISYSVKEAGRVKLEVYNIKGQLVRTLVDADHASGHYKQVFNSKDNRGRSISSGVYLLRMSAPGYKKTSKMILMQ